MKIIKTFSVGWDITPSWVPRPDVSEVTLNPLVGDARKFLERHYLHCFDEENVATECITPGECLSMIVLFALEQAKRQ